MPWLHQGSQVHPSISVQLGKGWESALHTNKGWGSSLGAGEG
jgi:hypothetical protein